MVTLHDAGLMKVFKKHSFCITSHRLKRKEGVKRGVEGRGGKNKLCRNHRVLTFVFS